MAIAAAKEKAVALDGELYCKPGNPRTINENSGHWGGNSFGNAMQNVAQSAPTSGEGNDDGPLPLGQFSVRANVSVTFDLLVPEEKPRNRDAQ